MGVDFAADLAHERDRHPGSVRALLIKNNRRPVLAGAGDDTGDLPVVRLISRSHETIFIENNHGAGFKNFAVMGQEAFLISPG